MKKTIKYFLAAGLALLGLAACEKPETPNVTPTVTISVAPATLSLEVGAKGTVTATVAPSGTAVTWTSSDASVATVADGVVTALKAGKTTVTAKAGEKTASCEVTVTEAAPQYSISLSDEILTIEAGKTATLTATVTPEGTPVQWGSTNEEVATVDGGVITALIPGDATITASVGTVTAQCLVTVTEAEIIDDGEGVAIDLCESISGWQTDGEIVLDMENKTQGGASVATSMTEGAQVQIIFQKPFETPIDASSIDPAKAVLSMDVWFEDVSKLNLGGNVEASQFEIGSSANPDEEEVSWPVSEWNIKNGWNHIELRFKGAKRNGTIDMSAIRRIRWYHAATIGTTTIKIDNIRIVERESGDTGEGIAIDLCESVSENGPWQTTGDIVLDLEDKTQGNASIATSLTEGDQVQIIFQKPFDTPIDASSISLEKATLSFDVWFDDVTKLRIGGNVEASQFEIGSSVNSDQEEVSWPVSSWNIHNGWNHMELRFQGAKTDGTINMAQIRRIRWYHAATIGSMTIKLDNIRIVERDASSTEKPSDPSAIYITHCEDMAGWEHVADIAIDTENHQEGKACLSATAPGAFVWIFNLEKAVDCSSINKTNGYLSFDIYVSNAAGMKLNDGGGQIEISSTVQDDNAEYNWDIRSMNLSDGWNHIDLPLSAASVSGGEPNMAAINHFRFYHVGWETDSPVAVKLDNIRMRNIGQ